MFTGIVEELGRVDAIEMHRAGARLRVGCKTVLDDAREGSSIAVNGVCLTALDLRGDSFAADLAPETLQRTNLGDTHERDRGEPGTASAGDRPVERSRCPRARGRNRRVFRSTLLTTTTGGCESAFLKNWTGTWFTRARSQSTASA